MAYMSGCSLVLENIRTHQQNLLWICPSHLKMVRVGKYLFGYGPFSLGIVLLNKELGRYELEVMSIDWGKYFYRKKWQKSIRLFGMKI